MQSVETVLLTGATGFVGRELLWRLARVPHVRVLCLIRAGDSAAAARRLDDVLDKAQPSPLTPEERSRCAAINGDLTAEKLGLTSDQWESLAGSVTRIVHGAASVDWAMPLDVARNINVLGTRRVIELAQAAHARGVLQAFDYISTCHVCGRKRGVILETDLDASSGFFNSYEQSKFEGETLVGAGGLPFCIFRLSMVVGDSHTGYASTFKVMYWPLKMLARGLAWAVPADPRGIIDLVPVDYVCDALEIIAADRSQRGKTFHLAAGPGRSSTIAEMLALAVKTFRVRAPLLIPPTLFNAAVRPILFLVVWGKRRRLLRKGKVYRPYFSFGAIFDTSQVRAALEPTGITPPLVQDYFQKLIDYAVASDWK
jgi:thioester reductase-like protein